MQLSKLWQQSQEKYFIWIHKLTFHSHPPNRFSVSAYKFPLLLSCFRCLQLIKLPWGARSHILLCGLNEVSWDTWAVRTIQSQRISLEAQINPAQTSVRTCRVKSILAAQCNTMQSRNRKAELVKECYGIRDPSGSLAPRGALWAGSQRSKRTRAWGSNAPLARRPCWFRHL